jgi:hypothetical protein
MAHVNAYVIYKQFHPEVTHQQFFVTLARQLLESGLSGSCVTRATRACRAAPIAVDDSGSDCSTPPDCDSPSPPQKKKSEPWTRGDQPCIPGEFAKPNYRRECQACYLSSNFTLGSVDAKRQRRKYYKKVAKGCITCGVALCDTKCWKKYHEEFFGITDYKTHSQWKI